MCSRKTALTPKEKRGFWNIPIRLVNKADWGHEQAQFEWCWLTGVNSRVSGGEERGTARGGLSFQWLYCKVEQSKGAAGGEVRLREGFYFVST